MIVPLSLPASISQDATCHHDVIDKNFLDPHLISIDDHFYVHVVIIQGYQQLNWKR